MRSRHYIMHQFGRFCSCSCQYIIEQTHLASSSSAASGSFAKAHEIQRRFNQFSLLPMWMWKRCQFIWRRICCPIRNGFVRNTVPHTHPIQENHLKRNEWKTFAIRWAQPTKKNYEQPSRMEWMEKIDCEQTVRQACSRLYDVGVTHKDTLLLLSVRHAAEFCPFAIHCKIKIEKCWLWPPPNHLGQATVLLICWAHLFCCKWPTENVHERKRHEARSWEKFCSKKNTHEMQHFDCN